MMFNLSTTLLTQAELMCVNKLTNAQKCLMKRYSCISIFEILTHCAHRNLSIFIAKAYSIHVVIRRGMATVEFPLRLTHSQSRVLSKLDKSINAFSPSRLLSCVRSPGVIHLARYQSITRTECGSYRLPCRPMNLVR